MTTLYATDLDGTLLDANAALSPESAALYRKLCQAGALISFVTARTPATVEPILSPASPSLPGVVMTGAGIWSPEKRMYEHVIYHTPSDVEKIDEICRRHGTTPFVYTLPKGAEALVVYHEAPKLNNVESMFVHERTISDLKTFHLHKHFHPEDAKCTILFFAMGDPALIQATAEDIRRETNCYASWYPDTYNPGISLLEVFANGVSKAEGMLRLKQMLGADRVVAFGDNLNDIPMLKAADVAVAVENAHPEVKAVADVVIGPNTSSSVMKYINDNYSANN